jgi:hypothetical protein
MRGMLLGLAVMVLGGVARGDVLVPYDNLGTVSGYLFGNHQAYAQSFTTGNFSSFGGSLQVKSLKLNLYISGTDLAASTTFDVGIYSALGALPGTPIGTRVGGSTATLSTTVGSSLFQADVLSNNIILNSNSTYWLVVERGAYTSGTNDLLAWAQGTSGSAGSAKGTTNTGGQWLNIATDTDRFGAQIAMVPEPGTLFLGGIAAVCGGGGVWWRRKRKAEVVETVETVTAV